MPPAKLALANLPTPLFRHDALDALVGTAVWVKRDDMTGGVETGNKIRKLEYLLADAKQQGATVVVTCGGLQSNHCRATALLARRVGMRAVLLLRNDGGLPSTPSGNFFLDRLVGAEVRLISATDYGSRDRLMAEAAQALGAAGEVAYVIPEGGSNGLGALGYVDAMAELWRQLEAKEAHAPSRFDAIAFACGSGGTAAGVGLGIAAHAVASEAWAFAVCDDRDYFEPLIERIAADAREQRPALGPAAPIKVFDGYKGPAYGVASPDQLAFIVEVARATGLVLDPVYTGKALWGLANLPVKPGAVCFVHTGGHPGLLAQADQFTSLGQF